MEVDELGWINAHATSTLHGDVREAQAIAQIVGETGVRVSAPKSMTGHLLGGSGAAEAAFSAMSLRDQQIPPHRQPGGSRSGVPSRLHHLPDVGGFPLCPLQLLGLRRDRQLHCP